MKTRTLLATGATVIVLAIGANQMLEPATTDDVQKQQQEQKTGDLSDSQERSAENKRNAGNDHVNAENDQKLIPGEYRPGAKPRLKLRIP